MTAGAATAKAATCEETRAKSPILPEGQSRARAALDEGRYTAKKEKENRVESRSERVEKR